MTIVYLEELIEQVENKYLAVNVIAKRARSLNDELLGAGLSQKQKPVSVATDELASGKLSYQKLDPDTTESDNQPLFSSESEESESEESDEENTLAELYGEDAAEEDGESVEEGDEELELSRTKTEDESDDSPE